MGEGFNRFQSRRRSQKVEVERSKSKGQSQKVLVPPWVGTGQKKRPTTVTDAPLFVDNPPGNLARRPLRNGPTSLNPRVFAEMKTLMCSVYTTFVLSRWTFWWNVKLRAGRVPFLNNETSPRHTLCALHVALPIGSTWLGPATRLPDIPSAAQNREFATRHTAWLCPPRGTKIRPWFLGVVLSVFG